MSDVLQNDPVFASAFSARSAALRGRPRETTAGVECRKEGDVIDETPMASESIDAVMEAQRDLVDVVHTLRRVVCVKG